jgi:hypothetical protein
MNYGDVKDLEDYLLYKKIEEWDDDKLVLDDGTVITLEESESDCCACAYGTFKKVKLDAVITNVEIGEEYTREEYGTNVSELRITLYHNLNPIAIADMYADAGNGGDYYSVGSFVVNGIHFPVVRA